MDIGEIQRVWEVEPIEVPELEPTSAELPANLTRQRSEEVMDFG